MSIMKEEIGKAREGRIPIIRAFEAIAKRSCPITLPIQVCLFLQDKDLVCRILRLQGFKVAGGERLCILAIGIGSRTVF